VSIPVETYTGVFIKDEYYGNTSSKYSKEAYNISVSSWETFKA